MPSDSRGQCQGQNASAEILEYILNTRSHTFFTECLAFLT